VSYFRPQQAGKIGPRTVHGFSDSTSRLSQNAGRIKAAGVLIENCLIRGLQSERMGTTWEQLLPNRGQNQLAARV
jgi:hypothetical protein